MIRIYGSSSKSFTESKKNKVFKNGFKIFNSILEEPGHGELDESLSFASALSASQNLTHLCCGWA